MTRRRKQPRPSLLECSLVLVRAPCYVNVYIIYPTNLYKYHYYTVYTVHMCMYVCICICICIYVYVCVCACSYGYVCLCKDIDI